MFRVWGQASAGKPGSTSLFNPPMCVWGGSLTSDEPTLMSHAELGFRVYFLIIVIIIVLFIIIIVFFFFFFWGGGGGGAINPRSKGP